MKFEIDDKIRGFLMGGVGIIVCLMFWFSLPSVLERIESFRKETTHAVKKVDLLPDEKKRIEKEIQDIRASIRANDKKGAQNYAAQYYELGIRLEKLGLILKAARAYERALRENDTHVFAHARLGSMRASLGDAHGAVLHLRRAIELDPATPERYISLGSVYAFDLRDPVTGRGVYIEGLIRTNSNLSLMKEFAVFLELIGEPTEAQLYWEAVLQKEPQNTAVKERLYRLRKQSAS